MDRPDAKRAGKRILLLSADGADRLGLLEDLSRVRDHSLTYRCHMHASVGALEKNQAQLLLQFMNLTG